MYRKLSFLFLFVIFAAVLPAATINIPADYASIQAGINAATDGDVVLVADGTYYENINFKGKAITVASLFYSNGDTTHINNTIIDGSKPSDPNKGSVVSFTSSEDTTSVLCGFTITGGTGTLYDSETKVGGGVYCENSGARISHNRIVGNKVAHHKSCNGGGIGCWPHINSSARYVIIENNVIESNSLTSSSNIDTYLNGGGICIVKGRITCNTVRGDSVFGKSRFSGGGGISAFCEDKANRTLVVISGNKITHNLVYAPGFGDRGGGWGGGIDVVFCNVQIIDNIISYNYAGGNNAVGAGIRLWKSKAISLIKHNTVSFNSLTTTPGWGGGIELWQTEGVQVIDNIIEGNNGASLAGGGIDENACSGNVINGNFIKKNIGGQQGGGIWAMNAKIINNAIVENNAIVGGGIYCMNETALESSQIINNTLTQNAATNTGAALAIAGGGKVILMNNICWGNDAPNFSEIRVLSGELHVAYSDIRFGAGMIEVTGGGTLNWLTGNIETDPKFADDTYHLASSSLCLGAGIHSYDFGGGVVCTCPAADCDGKPRPDPAGSNPDMGAMESPLGVDVENSAATEIPDSYSLAQNYPNPFNHSTTFEFALPKFSFVTLKVYNLRGELVVTLLEEMREAGIHQITWEAVDLASGVYLYQLLAGEFSQSKKLILMR